MVITGIDERERLEELRAAAVAAVLRGWAVVPGTTFDEDGAWHGHDGATHLRPISDSWAAEAITEWAEAYSVWGKRRHGLLLACSDTVHAVEIPAALGEEIFDPLAGADLLGPTVDAHPAGWVLLVEPGPLDLPTRPASHTPIPVTYREPGHWVPLPPTRLEHKPATWDLPPDGRRLPSAPQVLHLIANLPTGHD